MLTACKTTRSLLVLMLALSIFAGMAVAQSTTNGAIGGTVADKTGAVVANASVKTTNVATNATSTATTDATGRFRVIALQPGTYAVDVTSGNFAAYKRAGVVVELGRVTTLEVAMGVGSKAETVEVSTEAPLVNTQQQDFSSNMNQAAINELPINGRRWSAFALLTPGATPDGNFGLVSFRGISGLLNNSTVDGGDNNNAFYGEERGRTRIGYVISQSAIQEFQVNTSNYSAEYGRAAGGVVNAVTKSGSNGFHGDGFWYIRDAAMNASNPFSLISSVTPTGVKSVPFKPEDRRYQFGADVGGPIIKDKLFFFFSWDQQKRNFPGVATPSNASFFGAFTAAELATFTARGITAPQQQAGLDYLVSLSGQVPRRGDQILMFPKIDWNITNNQHLSLTYNRLRWDSPAGIQTQPVVSRSRTGWGNDGVKTDSFIAKLSSVASSTLVNEFRFQTSRDFLFGSAQTAAANEPTTAFGLPPGASIGGGGITIGTATYIPRDKNPVESRIQFADSVSWTHGRHLVKMGMDVNRVRDQVDSLSTKYGLFTYNNRVDWISDFTSPAGKRYTRFEQTFGLSQYKFTTLDLAGFVQDDFRMTPRLTLNMGVRYEYQSMPPAQLANPLLPASSKLPNDANNIGPRVGFAYDLKGDGKTAVRGGYGIYYGRFLNSTIASALTQTGVATATKGFNIAPSAVCAPLYPAVFSVAPTCGGLAPDVVLYGHSEGAPAIHQADFSVEHEFSKGNVVSATYLVSRGTHLPAFSDSNLPTTTKTLNYKIVGSPFTGQIQPIQVYTGLRPNTNFARIINVKDNIKSKYDALVLQMNRRLNSGLQLSANYTFARAEDGGQTSTTFVPFSGSSMFDPNNLKLEDGRSNLDIRHRFISNAVWQPQTFDHSNMFAKALLSGYTIAPIVIVSSGRPYTGSISGNAPGGCTGGLTVVNCAAASARAPWIKRNSYQQNMTYNVDMRIARRIPVKEVGSLELVAEAFNVFNHVNVTDVNTRQFTTGGTAAAPTLVADPLFGVPSGSAGTLTRERQMQFAIRFHF